MTVFRILPAAVFLAAGATALSAGPAVFEDDFDREVEGHWTRVAGDWRIQDGTMTHRTEGYPIHGQIVAEVPFTEGRIEAVGVARKANDYGFASLGLVIKYLDDQTRIWFRFGSYGSKNIDGLAPGFDKIPLGGGMPEIGREYRLVVIVRNGLIAAFIDDVMVGVARDPLAGKAGRPGLFSEAGVEYHDFRVTRFEE